MVGMDLVLISKGKQPTDKTVDLYCYPKNIIDLHLKPGQTVSEAELAAALNMSRTPVREAFIRLSEEGIMEIHP
jgi:DNA-binding FadR family transcriptional regulator